MQLIQPVALRGGVFGWRKGWSRDLKGAGNAARNLQTQIQLEHAIMANESKE